MKIRSGFVSNSSSSSFICITAGDKVILGNDDEPDFETDSTTIYIDMLIAELEEARSKGIKFIEITYGGGYEG